MFIVLFLIINSTNAFYIKPVNCKTANNMLFNYMKKETILNDYKDKNLLNEKLLYDLTKCMISTSERNIMNKFVKEEYYILCTINHEDIGLCVQETIDDTIYYRYIIINPEIYNKITKYYSKLIFIFLDVLNDNNKQYKINMESLPTHIKLNYLFHINQI